MADGAHIADVHVDVHPDASGFEQELRRQLKAMVVNAKTSPDTKDFKRELQEKLKTLGDFKVLVKPDTTGFRTKLTESLRRMAAVPVKVTPSTVGFRTELSRQLRGLPDVTLRVDARNALAAVASVDAAIKSLPATVNLDLDTATAAATLVNLKAAIQALSVGSINIDLDTTRAHTKIAALAAALAAVSAGRVRITVTMPNATSTGQRIGRAAAREFYRAFRAALRAMPPVAPPTGGAGRARTDGARHGGEFAEGFRNAVRAGIRSLPEPTIGPARNLVDQQIRDIRLALERLDGQTIGIDIDEQTAMRELDRLELELRSIQASAARGTQLNVDTATAEAALRRFRERMRDFGQDPASAARQGAESGGAFGNAYTRTLEAATRNLRPVQINASTDAVTRDIELVRQRLESLSQQRIGIDIDEQTALAEVQRLQNELIRLGRMSPEIRVQADTAAAAGQLAALRQQLERIRVTGEIQRLQAELHRLGTLRPTFQVRADMANAQARLAELQRQLAQIDGRRARAHVDVDDDDVDRARNNLVNFSSGGRAGIQSLIAAGIAIGPAIVPAAAAAAAAIAAIGPAAFAAGAGLGVSILAFKGVGEAVTALGAAQSKAGKTGATYANQQKQIADAQDQVRNAYRGVQEAERNLANAQRDALRAQQDITRARQEAKEALEDLDSAVKNNALSIRQAQLDLADAEKELKAVSNLPVDDRRRVEAQLQYDQAKQALDDLTTRQGRLAKEQEKASKAGVEGSEQVQAAQEKAADAQERVRDAAVALTRAQEQVVASQRNLQATIQSTSASGGSAVDSLKEKMAALSPAGQAFARFLFQVKDQFKQVKAAAEAGLFPGLQAGIQALLPVLPQIALFVGRVATAMGNLAAAAGKALASPFWVNFFDYMGQVAGPLLEALGGIVGGLARGFASLLIAFTPFSIQFTRGLAGIAQAFADWAADLAGSNGFNAFIEYVKAEGPKVLKLFGDLVVFVVKLGIAFAPLGNLILTGLVALFDYLAAQSPGHLAAIAGAIGAIALAIFAFTGGPITAVVAAVVAVAAAVAYAYTRFEWFRTGVSVVFDFLKRGFEAVKLGVETFVDAFKRGGDDVQNAGFLGAIERVGQQARRIFDGIKEGVENFVEGFKRGGTEIQQGGFVAYMQNLGMVARNVFEWLRDVGIPALAAFLDWIGPKAVAYVKATWQVFEFLFAVLNRVFAGITTAFGIAWTVWKAIFTAIVWYVENFMAPTFMFFWRNVIEPVWTGVKLAVSVAWGLIQVVFGLIEIGVRLLGMAFVAFYDNFLRPTWDKVKAAIETGWNFIRPIFEKFSNFLSDNVAPKFQQGVDRLGKIWETFKDNAKIPVKKFIDIIINGAIIGGFNWIARKVPGVEEVPPVEYPPGFATGGYIRGPGTGTSDSIMARLSNGEYVIPANIVRQLGVGFFDQLIGRRRPPYNTNGELGFKDGGVVDWAADKFDLLTDPVDHMKKKLAGVENVITEGRWVGDTLKDMTRSMVTGLIDWARDKVDSLFSFGNDSAIMPIGANASPGFPPWPSSPMAQRGDSGVWQNVVALIKSTGPVSGSFGNAYRRGDPLWHGCVPMDTKILTRRGWISRDEIRVGEDETIGYNPATGKNEWTRIVDVVEYEDAELWTLKNKWVELEVTPGHKWLVDQQVTVQTETVCTECGREFATGRGMTKHRADVHGVLTPRRERYEERLVATQDFKQSTRVHLSRPADLGGHLLITDDEAELIGWIFADGYMEPYGPTVVQSKPEEVQYLKGFMAKFPCSEYTRPPKGRQNHVIHRWKLSFVYWADLASRSKASKAEALEFVFGLSPSQRAAFLRGFLSADGTRDPRTQNERLGFAAFQVSGPLAEAIKVAAYLEGYRPDTRVKTEFDAGRYGTQPMEHIGLRTPIVKSRNLPVVAKRTAKVWCPTTTLGTWTARQGEEIFLTGNSGRAVDWMGYEQDALASFLAARRPLELIHRTRRRDYAFTRGRDKGSFHGSLMEAHRNHVHIAFRHGGLVGGGAGASIGGGDGAMLRIPYLFRDNGGYVPPGLSLVHNDTGRDEWMFSDAQMKEMFGNRSSRDDRRSGGGVHIDQFNAYANQSPHDIGQELDWIMRQRG